MKKFLMASAVCALGMTLTANAQTVTETVNFNADVTVECTVDGLDNVLFGTLTRRGNATAQVDTGIDVFCNQPSEVSFESLNGYLKLTTTNSANDSVSETDFTSASNPGFAAGVDYSAFMPQFGVGADTSIIAAGSPQTIGGVPALNANNLRIRYDTIAGTQPLLGGNYQDILTVTLTPQGV